MLTAAATKAGYAVKAVDAFVSAAASPGSSPCKWGASCYNFDPEHRRRFSHPERDAEVAPCVRSACKYGSACFQKNPAHLARFVHPGDRNYRIGLVKFEEGQTPDFDSMLQLFRFHDPDESGHLSKEEFRTAVETCQRLAPGKLGADFRKIWADIGGETQGHVNFRMFTHWIQTLGLDMPVGLNAVDTDLRPCRFRMGRDGARCSCPAFKVDARLEQLCECGHKDSMHRSDFSELKLSDLLEGSRCAHWSDSTGSRLVQVTDAAVLNRLQDLMTSTHKASDNWTRDRGCKLHGVGKCDHACASKNRVSVPSRYTLVAAYRNQNRDLWNKYTLLKTAISQECSRPSKVSTTPARVETSGSYVEGDPLDLGVNEWHLFHGTKPQAALGICSSNFRLSLAGSGATWKDPGKSSGTPLYGYGVYFAERITKADEYAEATTPDDALPVGEGGQQLFCSLLCRVVGGRTNVITTNEIQVDKLQRDVFDGPYHSIFGDRVSSLGKPYKEVVVYDKDQTYPEFLLVYTRQY